MKQSKQAHDDRLMVAVLMKRAEKKEQVPPSQDSASKVGLLINKSATGSPGMKLLPNPCGFGSLQEVTFHLISLSFSFFLKTKRRLDQCTSQNSLSGAVTFKWIPHKSKDEKENM